MKRVYWAQFSAACIALTFWVAPLHYSHANAPGAAEAPAPAAMAVRDVSLGADGALHGQVVNAAGAAASGKWVVVRKSDGTFVEALSDESGRFHVSDLRGGMYAISAGGPAQLCRVWQNGTAPPAARGELLLVEGEQAHRGQHGGLNWRSPWLWAGVIVAAAAIPIIINALKDDAS